MCLLKVPTQFEIAMLHEEGDIPLLSDVCDIAFPPSLDVVIEKCLAKLPQDRYQSAKEMAIDLTRIREGKNLDAYSWEVSQQKADSDVYEAEPSGGRLGAYALLSIFGLCLAGLAVVMIIAKPPQSARVRLTRDISESRSAARTMEVLTKLDADSEVASRNISLNPRAEAAVRTYLKRAPRFFSQVVKESDGRKRRVFDFPKAFTLGQLVWFVDRSFHTIDASGVVSVPANVGCIFRSDKVLTAYPELLGHFRKDDLVELDLAGAPPSPELALPFVSRLTSLQMLTLRRVPIKSDSFKYLKCLTNLRELSLESCPADSLSLVSLASLTSLRFLRLTDAANISRLLQVLSQKPSLISLFLSQVELSNKDIAAIASLKSLRFLTLRSGSIDNRHLETLTSLNNLEQLDVTNSAVDDKCFDSLCKFRKLEQLRVPDVLISPGFETKLKKVLPRLRVFE